ELLERGWRGAGQGADNLDERLQQLEYQELAGDGREPRGNLRLEVRHSRARGGLRLQSRGRYELAAAGQSHGADRTGYGVRHSTMVVPKACGPAHRTLRAGLVDGSATYCESARFRRMEPFPVVM